MMCILVLFLLLGVCTGSNITRRAFKCGGPEYLTATSGLIDSHGGHEAGLNYGKDMDCVWTIEAARGMYVQIWPETFDIENETRCGYDYLELLDGDSIHARNMGRFCGTFMDAISSTQRFLTVHFVTDGDVQLSGFRLRYNFTDVTLRVCDPVEYRCNNSKCVPASYLCDADDDCGDASDELSCTGRVVTCAQDEFLCRDRTDCVLLSWLCDGDNDCGDSSDELTTNCLTAATTTRPVMVNSVTCGQLNRTGISGTISSPNYPANYGNDILCQWIVKATPEYFTHVWNQTAPALSTISPYSLSRPAAPELPFHRSTDFTVGPFCGDSSPGRLTVSGNQVTILFSADDSETYMGFSLQWRALMDDLLANATNSPPVQNCRYTLSISGTGSLHSPYFGHTNYPPSAICTWKLLAPRGNIIRLHFNSFKLENSTHCAGDNVRIFDGINSNANVLGEFCGRTTPPDLLSTKYQILLFFYSDGTVEDEGFNITYSLEDHPVSPTVFEDDGCHGQTKLLSSATGTVTSPRYDGMSPYENSQDCSWRIDAPTGSVITVTFNDFLLEKIDGCTYDYLELDDGPSNQSIRLARLCGLQFPDDITSSGASFFIRFVSDPDVAGSGFSLSYRIHSPVVGNGCGHPAIAPIETSHKIVGGREAIANSWPWMLSLRLNGSHTCGGTLIGDSWVLTAAHCFEANRRTADWSVSAGKHHILKPEMFAQTRDVGKIIVHSQYNYMTTDNDIALVKVTVPFYINAYVSNVCLPSTPPSVGEGGFVIGWGVVEGTCCPGVLKQVTLPIMNSTKCNRRDYLHGQVTGNMFCAGYDNGGQDACQGDSGGPLLSKKDGRWYIQGITSFGSGCADFHSPGVYTRVYNYLRWIRQKIALN